MEKLHSNNKREMVSIIIVDYNGYEDTVECIESLKKCVYDNYNIIVVINGNSKDKLKNYIDHINGTDYIETENYGFADACNKGIQYAKNKYNSSLYLLLNNDTVVTPNFLQHLVDEYKKNFGIITGKILYYFDKKTVWYAGGTYNITNGISEHIGLNTIDKESYSKNKKISFVTGCLMLIPWKIIKTIGYLDESYFMYSEDADYSIRAMKAGYDLFYCGEAEIYHKVSQSSNNNSKFQNYYMMRNYLILVKKYVRYKIWACILFGIRCTKDIIKKRVDFITVVKAWKDALFVTNYKRNNI